MGARAVLSILNGNASAELWAQAISEEHPNPAADEKECGDCPLREGGEWEPAALVVLASRPVLCGHLATRWGCHSRQNICAGAARVAALVLEVKRTEVERRRI